MKHEWVIRGICVLIGYLATSVLAAPARLHVPSPDWRDQIIYFAMTDRFDDGDPRNNDMGAGEYQQGDSSRYQGGDLAGAIRRLDYIRGLGATALWLTPPVANQWTDPSNSYTGFHGYWAENFKAIDRHMGTLADYQKLSRELHRRDMYLVQDIVVNHTGNYFRLRPESDGTDPARFYEPHTGSPPVSRPSQWPFSMNDPRIPEQRRAGVYHWTPDISDNSNHDQELNYQMAGLDDLNVESLIVRRALRNSYGYWIREAGVDAFRVDTALYVPAEYFEDFLYSRDVAAPGIFAVARTSGRQRFHVFGEAFAIDRPGETDKARRIETYVRSPEGRPRMPGMLNFPLYGSLVDAFARGRPSAELGQRIESMMRVHSRPHLMVNFLDNHDVDRWLAGGSEVALKQALLAIMTLPGIPTLYYGTEQGLVEQRASMFAAGVGSGGRDRFDTASPLYRYTASAVALRKAHRLFSRGLPTVLRGTAVGPGALAWKMVRGKDAAVVVFNTSDTEVLLDSLATGFARGTRLVGLFGIHRKPSDIVVGEGGRVTLRLPARAGMVWRAAGTTGSVRRSPGPRVTLEPLPSASVEGDFTVAGMAYGVERVGVVVDGDLAGATVAIPDAHGRWKALVSTRRMMEPAVDHRLVAWAEAADPTPPLNFRVSLPRQLVADVEDPAGDDRGPTGRYRYPAERTFGPGTMDLRRIRALTAGGALRIEVDMQSFSTIWAPLNGFDHVAFTIFVELPGRRDGVRVMPYQNAELPAGMRWHLRLRAHGWSNALFAPEGAGPAADGVPITPMAQIESDPATKTIRFTLPSAALGDPDSLSGARIYITTWDYDGGYRPLSPEGGPFVFGGGSATEPRIMDDSGIIVLP